MNLHEPETREALMELEGARVEAVELIVSDLGKGWVKLDLRHRGTDDGAARIEFIGTCANLRPWNPETGDFR